MIRVTWVDSNTLPSRAATSSSTRIASTHASTTMDDLLTEIRAIRSEMYEGFKNLNDWMDHFERSFTDPPFQ